MEILFIKGNTNNNPFTLHVSLMICFLLLLLSPKTEARAGAKLPELKIEGRYLVNKNGDHVNLHGFWQTYSPWFNGDAWGVHNWGDYNAAQCLRYNKAEIDKILQSGLKVDFMRLHMDSYWSLNRNRPWPTDRQEYEDFNEDLFKQYLESVFVPMVEYVISKGLYVVLMPGYSSPEYLEYGDQFYQVLEKLWTNISKHPKIANNTDVMFEIVNEPRSIKVNGIVGNNDDLHNKELTRYMQHFVDLIRTNANNIIWVPGTGYQSQYVGYAKYRMQGENLGFAVHCYPGWYGSDAEKESAELGGSMGGGYEAFQAGWDAQIMPAAEIAPIMITEMDWAPAVYNKSWGKSFTGEAGGSGFGANFKYLADKTGNVSYITFTAPNDLADFAVKSIETTTNYWNDPRGCPWQIYYWYKEYAEGRTQPLSCDQLKIGGLSSDAVLNIGIGGNRDLVVNAIQSNSVVFPLTTGVTLTSSDESIVSVDGNKIVAMAEGQATIDVEALGKKTSCTVVVNGLFPLVEGMFNPSIWESGTFNSSAGQLITGQYGFGGWNFGTPLDLSSYNYLIVYLKKNATDSGQWSASFRLFCNNSYWSSPYCTNCGGKSKIVVPLKNQNNDDGSAFDSSHVYIAGFWTLGGENNSVFIDKIVASNDGENPLEIGNVTIEDAVQMHYQLYYINGQEAPADAEGLLIKRFSNGTAKKVLVR